jgi:DNA polymerase elongation subunit (family B)
MERGRMKVVYGHTDSIYVKIDDVETAEKICEDLNTHVQSLFPNPMELDPHPVNLEFEKYYKSLGVGCTKNRNAGFISWKDGEWLTTPEFVVTGFSMKRITETKLGREVQESVLKMWASEKSEREIVNFLLLKFNDVMNGNIPLTDVINRSRVRANRMKVKLSCGHINTFGELIENGGNCKEEILDEYTSEVRQCNGADPKTLEGKRPNIGSGILGVLYYNSMNCDNKIDDSFVYVKVVPNALYRFFHPLKKELIQTTYVSAHEIKELEEYDVDWMHYANVVVKKATPIFKAMDWSIEQIRRDLKQKTLEDWF